MPNVRSIGNGAVIGAGAVVTKDISPYAIVGGNPAQIIRYRFPSPIIEELTASQWWEKSIKEIKPVINEFLQPYQSTNI